MGKYIGLVIGVFAVLLALIFVLTNRTPDSYDLIMLIAGNAVLAILSVVAYVMVNNALKNPNPNAFIRAKMAGTMLRIFISIAGIVSFAYLKGKTPATKPTIFLLLGMYVIYTILEAAVLSKKGRKGA